jgi:hypothetical protein
MFEKEGWFCEACREPGCHGRCEKLVFGLGSGKPFALRDGGFGFLRKTGLKVFSGFSRHGQTGNDVFTLSMRRPDLKISSFTNHP